MTSKLKETENFEINLSVDNLQEDLNAPVYCWIIGELDDNNKIRTVCYGIFTKDMLPPTEGWFYIGLFISDIGESHERSGRLT